MSEGDRIESVRRLWARMAQGRELCLCVSGSIARREETTHSDMDMLLLHEDSDSSRALAAQCMQYLHEEIEHVSVVARSLVNCRSMLGDDVRSWVSQMDAQRIAGDEVLFCRFRRDMQQQAIEMKAQVIRELETLAYDRHAHYGKTLALLEPNVKNSAGALRDIHTMYYVGLLDLAGALDCDAENWPAVEQVLEQSSLQPVRRQKLVDAYRFLLKTRAALHACSGHLHDTLDFEIQQSVASSLGYGSMRDKSAVEEFMRDYYRHAHTVHVALQLLFADHDTLSTKYVHTVSAEEIMRRFLRQATSGEEVDISLVRVLDSTGELNFLSRECLHTFDRMIREGTHVFSALSRMHEMRVLGQVFPEFAALSRYFQHNMYHFFTADEHTLRTIECVEQLSSGEAHVSLVLAEVENRSVLYYALLLHDIAKPVDLQRHEHVGADMVPEIMRRFGRMDAVDDVRFLVREHLRMEQLAFRRNFHDTATMKPFVERVGSLERLRLLYVLTYADMCALNPGVLTEWKKELLSELYEAAKDMLINGIDGKKPQAPLPSVVEPVSHMDHHDFQTSVQDILEGELMRMHVLHHRSYSEVTLFCVDRPQLLSRLSAAFFGADASIVDAAIETRNDVAIDMFRVVNIIDGGPLSADQTHDLRSLVREVCTGELDVDQLYSSCRRKWIRKLRKLPRSNIKTAVEYVDHRTVDNERQTIVEVYAPDTFGLLYLLSAELSLFGLNVVFAKIATRVDGVVDSFYVVDRNGNPFDDNARQEELRSRILERITELKS